MLLPYNRPPYYQIIVYISSGLWFSDSVLYPWSGSNAKCLKNNVSKLFFNVTRRRRMLTNWRGNRSTRDSESDGRRRASVETEMVKLSIRSNGLASRNYLNQSCKLSSTRLELLHERVSEPLNTIVLRSPLLQKHFLSTIGRSDSAEPRSCAKTGGNPIFRKWRASIIRVIQTLEVLF